MGNALNDSLDPALAVLEPGAVGNRRLRNLVTEKNPPCCNPLPGCSHSLQPAPENSQCEPHAGNCRSVHQGQVSERWDCVFTAIGLSYQIVTKGVIMSRNPNWKSLTFLIGGSIGLLTGLAAAYLVVKKQEEGGEKLRLTSGDGAKIGMGIATLLKTISEAGKR